MDISIRPAADDLAEQLIDWRRYLHAHPELSGQEESTAAFIVDQLRAMGYEPQQRVGDTFGVVADLRVNDGPAIALRADTDALPVTEVSDAPYASTRPGAMHACGHDAHVTMLLGAAKLLSAHKQHLSRSVRFIFQPSEEKWPGGAAPMIDAGVLDGVDAAYGLHVWSEMPIGTIGTRVGPFMSSANELDITIHGRGGHAAMPQQCVDPVLVAAQVIVALQSVISRSIAMAESAVVSVTQINGGTASNIIPPEVKLRGTVRTLNDATLATVTRRIREIVDGVTQAQGATATIDIPPGYPALINDQGAIEHALAAARAVGFSEDQLLTLPPQGGGEDFAYFARKVPAAFLFVGARNEDKGCQYPHHHPRFDIDEDALPLGTALLAQIALSVS